jgi:hypothetical protein
VLAQVFGGDVKLYFAPDERVPPPGAPTEYASLGNIAPTAWPSGFASYGDRTGSRAPVTGQLSEHAKEALKRMGITQ